MYNGQTPKKVEIFSSDVSLVSKQMKPTQALTLTQVSDETIELGTLATDKIMEIVVEACDEYLGCDPSPFELKGEGIKPVQVVGTGSRVGEDPTITIRATGMYETWIRNGLVDTLRDAIREAQKCKDVPQVNACNSPHACGRSGKSSWR
jgi:hypothetical protein